MGCVLALALHLNQTIQNQAWEKRQVWNGCEHTGTQRSRSQLVSNHPIWTELESEEQIKGRDNFRTFSKKFTFKFPV